MNPNFAITGPALLTGVGIGVLVLLAIIFVGRFYFNRQSRSNLAERYRDEKRSSRLAARNKYPEVNVFNYSPMFLRIAAIAVLTLVIGAFSWTIYDKEVYIPEDAMVFDMDIEVEKPRTAEPPPPPPPPPPPKIEAVAEIDIDEEDEFEFEDQSIDADTYIDAPVYEEKEDAPPPPPPPPPPPKEEAEEIFKVVEEMPRFPGCEEMTASASEKRMCANRKMLQYIYEHIRYPAVARDNNIEGTVVVSFVVDTDGSIDDAQVVRDIGGGCGTEALRVVEMMNSMPQKWTPGRQRGREVKVLFNLPVKFKLEMN